MAASVLTSQALCCKCLSSSSIEPFRPENLFAHSSLCRTPNFRSFSTQKGHLSSLQVQTPLSSAFICLAARRKPPSPTITNFSDDNFRRVLQIVLWATEAIYILWLFLLPYAPGDPIWAISSDTVNSLLGLSLNFFFILPLINSVGIHLIEGPVLHPMSEGLFNFVIGWTLMFAPLLYSDRKRDRYSGSIDVLWGLQMFLTNTFLIPYMAIRLNEVSSDSSPPKRSKLGFLMVNNARLVGLVGGSVCAISIVWAFFGRGEGNFGGIAERMEFLMNYIGSERLAYAFIWDICLYTIFQPWLIGSNLRNVPESKVGIVNSLRFVPVVGLIAYLLFLDLEFSEQS